MKFFLSRFVQAVIVMFSVATALFILVRLVPGNPAQVIAGPDASRQTVLDIEREYELNRSVPVQYLHWLGQLLTGHLGESVIYQVGVASLIRQAIPATVQLLIGGMFIALVLGIVLGVVAAINARKAPDFLVGVGTALALGMPAFWTGILAIIVFAVKLHWLPAGGFVSVTVNPVEGMKDLVLPCLVLGSFVGSYLARFVRSGMLEALDSDFVRTARAKGLPERTVIFRHALRSALVPLLTVIGIQVGLLIGGAVVIEDVFAMPGIGSLVITAISQRDYPVIQGGVLVLVAAFSAVNLLVDLLYSVADPRIRR